MSRWEVWIWMSLGTLAHAWVNGGWDRALDAVACFGFAMLVHWLSFPMMRFIRRGLGISTE